MRWRHLTTACLLVVASIAGSNVSAAAAGGTTNGPVLVGSSFRSELRTTAGTLAASMDFASFRPAEFSPAGDQIADGHTSCLDDTCDTVSSTVVVRDADGSSAEYGAFDGMVESISWAPDASAVAVLVSDRPGGVDTIYALPLDGAPAAELVSDSASFDVEFFGEISWSPVGDSIVFVASEVDENGTSESNDFDQLYTISAGGGTPERYNQHLSTQCPCRLLSFVDPQWSNDGSHVVAEVQDETIPDEGDSVDIRYVGTIGPGQSIPVAVTSLRDPELGWSSWRGPEYSPDGTRILFQDTDDDGSTMYTATVAAGGGARTRLPDSLHFALDWQPCPNGVCASWGASEKVPSTITLNYSNLTGKIRTNGQVTPARAGQSVTLRLDKKVGARWKPVKAKSQSLSAKSRYVISFTQPSAFECRLTASYGGDSRTKPSSAVKFFSC